MILSYPAERGRRLLKEGLAKGKNREGIHLFFLENTPVPPYVVRRITG
jgi:hypothetical protein